MPIFPGEIGTSSSLLPVIELYIFISITSAVRRFKIVRVFRAGLKIMLQSAPSWY
jgi:hypothetical protein